MSEEMVNPRRRRLLAITTGLGAIGTVFAAAPFVISMLPSARARAAGAPVEADISKLEPGQLLTVVWRGKPVWILHRSPEMLAELPDNDGRLVDPHSTNTDQQPPYCKNEYRSIKAPIFVVIGICTHLGCVPLPKLKAGAQSGMPADWPGGWFCPCHGSKFDLAGRVFKNVPAPSNLVVPPYRFLSDTRILVGKDPKKGAA